MIPVRRWLAAVTVIFCLSIAAGAADWPTKVVRIIVPFAAGGSSDTLGRLVAEPLS